MFMMKVVSQLTEALKASMMQGGGGVTRLLLNVHPELVVQGVQDLTLKRVMSKLQLMAVAVSLARRCTITCW